MSRLHCIKEKWCRTFSKDHFSRGVLSSQRCESTNSSLSRRLNKLAGLFDFYNIFSGVMSEWRPKEKNDNVRNKEGYPDVDLSHVSILRQVMMINMYKVFKGEQVKGQGYYHDQVHSIQNGMTIEHVYFVFEK